MSSGIRPFTIFYNRDWLQKKKKSTKSWILNIQIYGFFFRVSQLREITKELLQAKSDYKELEVN